MHVSRIYNVHTILFPYLPDEISLQLEWARLQSGVALDSPFYGWGCTTRIFKLIVTTCYPLPSTVIVCIYNDIRGRWELSASELSSCALGAVVVYTYTYTINIHTVN